MKVAEQAYDAMRRAVWTLHTLWQLIGSLSSPHASTGKRKKMRSTMQRTGNAGRVIKTIVCTAMAQCTTAMRQGALAHTGTWPNGAEQGTEVTTETHQKSRVVNVTFRRGEELAKRMQQPWQKDEFWPTKNLQGAELKETTKVALTITKEAEPWEPCDELHIYTRMAQLQKQKQAGEWSY